MVQTGGAGHDNTDTAEGKVVVNLGGTHDWSAGGNGSTDPTSGLIAYEAVGGDLAAATLEVGSGVITFSLTGQAGSDRAVYLVLPMKALGMPDLKDASNLFVYADINMSTLGTVTGDGMQLSLKNGDWANDSFDENLANTINYNAGNRKTSVDTARNNANTGANTNITNWSNAGRLWARECAGVATGGFHEATGPSSTSPTRITYDDWHVRTLGANAPYLVIRIRGKTGSGVCAGTISGLGCTII